MKMLLNFTPRPAGLWEFSTFMANCFDMAQRGLLLFILLACFPIFAQRIMKTPPYLEKDDTVAIIATARKIDRSTLEPGIRLLESWGLKVILGRSIGKEEHQLAGPDWLRATDLQEMLDNPSVKAIWAAKGGYGTVRIVDRVNFAGFAKNPKWLIGFSDVTVLHSHANNMGIESLHAMMAISTPNASSDAKLTLRRALFGEKLKYELSAHPFNREGKAEGELVGGNLSVLYSIMGSSSQVDHKGKILFIEDLDEYLYHIDRMMMNLKRNGWFNELRAVIIGGMTSMNDNEIPWGKDALEIVREIFKDYTFPVIYNFPAGHIKDNRAMIFGRNVKVEVKPEGSTVVFD